MNVRNRAADVASRTDVLAAVDLIGSTDDRTVETQIELSEIPAPPFGEEHRARRMLELSEAAGLGAPHIDAVGNVVASRQGTAALPPLVVSAHLDTIFPAGTDVTVRRDGNLLRGPGISDDARGLTAMLTIARALESASIFTEVPLLFVATVGEEGPGDLRGVKHLFSDAGAAHQAAGFISLDGAGLERIVVNGLGSRRFRITSRGPGGHSWTDWGTPNPISALMEVGRRLNRIKLCANPQSTLTLSRVGGGTSINAIPQNAWLEIDTRSSDGQQLDGIEVSLRDIVRSVGSEWSALTFELSVIGNRPGGSTPVAHPLVEAAVAATHHQNRTPVMALSSTDANIPMSLGIAALTLGCGGEAGQAHTTDEWYRNQAGPEGIIRALHTVLLFAGVA
ncbi:MAG: M20/M25/M40 family metallo-hydrolase [Gemmatimonadetes bacterium]|nr:M20/M25/M40 family metallo-hydrolase [Gemmatimonadota bacterium]MDA1104154.1 M20/M25/M40 family metallo-hydrolase [Gemmatimonadota bacterium]